MNLLKEELQKLMNEEKQLSFLLSVNQRSQAVLSGRIYEQLTDEPEKETPVYAMPQVRKKPVLTVADKLGNHMQEVYGGKTTLINHIMDALNTLEEPLDIKTIREFVVEQGRECSEAGIAYSLREALKKGLVKKALVQGKTFWSLNPAKVVRKKKKPHTKPNYGIGRAIAELVNEKGQGTVLTPPMILEEIQDESHFQQATESLVKETIQGWIRDGKPGIEPKSLGDRPAYTFKQPIRL